MTMTDLALGLTALAVLPAMWRIARGPQGTDRVVAAEMVFIAAVAALVLVSRRLDEPVLLDIALVAVLGGFVATLSLTRLLRRGEDRS
jgi:multicomponent Na+:H+ antiporter subunit F